MKPLPQNVCDQIIGRIVRDFGDGPVPDDRYVFDVITRTPAGFIDAHVPCHKLLNEVRNEESLFLIFDPSPQNLAAVWTLLRRLKIEETPGLEISGAALPRFFDDMDCDFYVATPDISWLAIASHCDRIVDGQRIVWRAKQT